AAQGTEGHTVALDKGGEILWCGQADAIARRLQTARQGNARLDIAARASGEDGEFHAGPGSLCGLCRRLTIRATMSPRPPSIIRQSDGIAQPTGDDALRRCADCRSNRAEKAAGDLPGLSAV